MISSLAQRFSLIFRNTATLLCGLALFSLLGVSTYAQSSDQLFRGTWQIDAPDQGALIIIVKNQGRASYFWGDNADRTVYQGTWASTAETATITWADGSQHRIGRDSLGFGITYILPNGSERYTAQAQQVPSEILGQWAKPPTKEAEIVSARDQARGFFGIWRIGESDAAADYVFVESDRSAASTLGGNEGLRGAWAKQGSELHIVWDSGQYSILRPNQRAFIYKTIQPGQIIEDDESEIRPAVRTIEDKVPGTWLSNYQQERQIHTGGIAFSSRKTARAFYRGNWIAKRANNSFERIDIQRFGGLSTSADRSLDGDWRMQGQDIFMRWDDGMREILSPIGRGFVIHEYKPGRPLDGVPTRVYAAAPADSAKLAEHLKGRADVARQIISLAEAAGIDPSQQEDTGWGRTFSRWVWPFGEDEAAPSPDAMLQQEYEEARESDPWWWPFWSERSANEVEETQATGESDTAPQPDSTLEGEAIETTPNATQTGAAAEATKENSPNTAAESSEKKRRSARDWLWPF